MVTPAHDTCAMYFDTDNKVVLHSDIIRYTSVGPVHAVIAGVGRTADTRTVVN